MNLYIRYFDKETLVHSVEEAAAFLNEIPDVHVNDNMLEDLRQFAESPAFYPKRYKVMPRIYFIVIKTTAESLEEFKLNKRKNEPETAGAIRDERHAELEAERPGWYEGSVVFKRVIPIGDTGKFQYCDTPFVARVKAGSPLECHAIIVQHLQNRQDVDSRSQFPSARGKNFNYKYLGETLPG